MGRLARYSVQFAVLQERGVVYLRPDQAGSIPGFRRLASKQGLRVRTHRPKDSTIIKVHLEEKDDNDND